MTKSPTDLKLLEYVFKEYYGDFSSFNEENPSRQFKNHVPIDIEKIAKHFDVDGDIVFGRFYFHLQEKLRIRRHDGVEVPFFLKHKAAGEKTVHEVHFPMLASAVASLRESRDQYLWTMRLAVGSLIISAIAVCIGLVSLLIHQG